jgi:hypothetical protein
MIGHMNGPPAFTISHMARIIPDHAAPDEGVSGLARDGCHRRAFGAEQQPHGAHGARVDHLGGYTLPAFHHQSPGLRSIDTARGDRHTRRSGFYPLPR